MQLHYNILWIDDEINKFQIAGDIDRVNNYLIELGFAPHIIPLSEGKDLDDHFASYKFDLIVSDFNIEEGHHGDDLIRSIREKQIFTEVLFYSSQTNLQAIAEKLLGVDRISFHSGRRELIEKIETLIALSVQRLLELNATRGLITDETSELDVIIEELVMHLVFDKLNLTQEQQDEIITNYVEGYLRKGPENFFQKYKERGFRDLFHKIEASRKWSIFRDLLKKLKDSKEISEFLQKNKTYCSEVIAVRNKFAHAKAISKDNVLYLSGFGPDGEAFLCDDKQCINIRKSLIQHRENFDALRAYLEI
jgi:hypothetical protein